jgi:hypothetical protein
VNLRFAIGVLVATGLSAGAGTAFAHDTNIQTEYDFSFVETHTNSPGWDTNWEARLTSENPACIRNRHAVIVGTFDGERKVIDEDLSSRNGFLRLGEEGGPAQSDALERLVFKVVKKDIGSGNHRHVCGSPDKIVQTFS